MHDALVERVEPFYRLAFTFWTRAKTNQRERKRRHHFPIRRLFDPRRKQLRQAAVFAYPRRQTFVSEVTHHHPQLQRAETPSELNTVIRSAAHLLLFGSAKIFRHQRESTLEQIHVPAIENRK